MKKIVDIIEEAKGPKTTDIFVVAGWGHSDSWPAQHTRIFRVHATNSLMNALKKHKSTFFFNGGAPGKHLTDKEQNALDGLEKEFKNYVGYEYHNLPCGVFGYCLAVDKGHASDFTSGPTEIEKPF